MRVKIHVVVVVIGTLTLSPAWARDTVPETPVADPSEWIGDVDELLSILDRHHPDMNRTHTDAEWRAAADDLKRSLPDATVEEAVWGFKRLAAMLGDSHTFFRSPKGVLPPEYLPILCRAFADGFYVRTGHVDCQAIFGRRISSINGVPIAEVYDRLRPYISADNEWSAIDQFKTLVRYASLLRVVGLLADDADEIDLGVAGEKGEERFVVRLSRDSFVTSDWRDTDRRDVAKPFYRTLDRNFDFRFDPDSGTLHLLCDKIRDEDNETFRAFSERLLQVADEKIAAGEFRRLVIDVRDNGGGNGYLWQPLVRGITRRPEIDRHGGLLVLMNRDTFSAGWLLVSELESRTAAILVGEPIAHRPNSFGDTEPFVLPRSGIEIRCSALYWQTSDPRDARHRIDPELLVIESFEDFYNRRDPVLAAVLFLATKDVTPLPWSQPNQRWMYKAEDAYRRGVPDPRSMLSGELGTETIIRWLP